MRIVAGRWKGRVLKAPSSQDIRPTSDRLRESLFNILAHGHDIEINGARVLDLFAGTGALGLEALSRGASFALFVDEGAEARALIRENTQTLGAAGITRLFRRDATRLGPVAPFQPFTLVFADPPYGKGLGEKAIASARDGGWLAPDALIVVEERGDAEVAAPEGFEHIERREAGDSQIVFLRHRA
ncbi:DNA methyltransferase [Agaricicola taiwanensis]|uniref:DNA methyltransferase n=1 Tax=Agaricicola taiwanensis TaxID=591372 RepID=A0A8J2YDJ8_9RHOB|nr:16S rRNA (guanine(966)-N(2))-methyltransferase RsmD [Agaricicola taiwanensis]GGE34259.1 DNA methyltransferase [Agaricicola taiwanensis]